MTETVRLQRTWLLYACPTVLLAALASNFWLDDWAIDCASVSWGRMVSFMGGTWRSLPPRAIGILSFAALAIIVWPWIAKRAPIVDRSWTAVACGTALLVFAIEGLAYQAGDVWPGQSTDAMLALVSTSVGGPAVFLCLRSAIVELLVVIAAVLAPRGLLARLRPGAFVRATAQQM